MRGFLIAGAIGLSIVLMGCGEKAEAETPPTPPGQPIPEGTPMPKDGEILNKDLKLGLCRRNAELWGKDSKEQAQECKKDLGQEVCEKYYDKAACE